jgi:hypothetical protein
MNPFARQRRHIKVRALVEVIDATGLRPTHTDVECWSRDVWENVVELANLTRDPDDQFRMPSDETKAAVLEIYRARERFVAVTRERVALGERTKAGQVLTFVRPIEPDPVVAMKRKNAERIERARRSRGVRQ